MLSLALLAAPAFAAETWDGLSFYVGDPHAHTGVSADAWASDIGDGCGSHVRCGAVATVREYALAHGLDWVAFSDHVNGVDHLPVEAEWTALRDQLLAYDDDDGLVIVPAAEVWFDRTEGELGHKNLLMFGDDSALAGVELADLSPSGGEPTRLDDCDEIATWMEDLESRFGPAVLIPHHPALEAPMPTDWSCHHPQWEVAAEVYSHFGNSLGGHLDADPPLGPENDDGWVHVALDPDGEAHRLGFFGGSDFHGTQPGTLCVESSTRHYGSGAFTVAWLDEGTPFSRSALYEAILARHTYATSGPIVPLRVTYEVAGTQYGPGEDVEVPGGERLTVSVQLDPATDLTETTVWLETPDAVYPLEFDTDGAWAAWIEEMPAWAYVVVDLDGPSWFDEDWCDDEGEDDLDHIWVSPAWFTEVDHDDDADGVSWAAGDCDDDDAAVFPGAEDAWYDGVDADCDGRNDYDADEDGAFMVIDCDDTDPSVHPGATDLPYDGVDADCAGDDDYDFDGDGHRPFRFGGDDCRDRDPRVYTGAYDRWYDGVDADCARNDDFDRDGDGVRPPPRGTDPDDRDPSVF